jgi:hypothetical protein
MCIVVYGVCGVVYVMWSSVYGVCAICGLCGVCGLWYMGCVCVCVCNGCGGYRTAYTGWVFSLRLVGPGNIPQVVSFAGVFQGHQLGGSCFLLISSSVFTSL